MLLPRFPLLRLALPSRWDELDDDVGIGNDAVLSAFGGRRGDWFDELVDLLISDLDGIVIQEVWN